MAEDALPRLVYIGDVPVERTTGGSVALWRLLETYPPGRLLIVETRGSNPAGRLPDVRYVRLSPVLARLAHSRIAPLAHAVLLLTARFRARALARVLRGFAPQAVLTVTHGASWLTASEVATRFGAPLYLINHDCWFEMLTAPARFRDWLEREFTAVYRQARARFCVSAEIAEFYRERYGAPGLVLYPGRARDRAAYSAWPGERAAGAFTVAYAGGIFDGCAQVLAHVAELLSDLGGTLLVFSALPEHAAVRRQLARANVVVRDFLPEDRFLDTLRAEADALLVVRERGMGLNALMSFPSKIVDYSAAGLPLLVYAPAQSAAAAWIRQRPGAALLVAEGDTEGLREALSALAVDAPLRKRLGESIVSAGAACFGHEVVERTFLAALAS